MRGAADYAAGHIPGALSFPIEKIEADPDGFREAVRASLDGAKAAILYGAGGLTPEIHRVAAMLEGHGKLAIYVYPAGFAEWREAGRPVE